jgi:phage terminase large subunit-like protein
VTFAEFCKRIGFAPEAFQKRIARVALDGAPEVLVLLPRGQGKTTLMAAVAVYHLLTVEGAAVYCAASSRDQARILFEAAARFARTLEHPNLVIRHLEIRYCEDPARFKEFSRHLRVLAADAPRLQGLSPTLAIIDELHAHPNAEVYIALKTAQVKNPGSRLVTISTAGHDTRSVLGQLRDKALASKVTRKGFVTDAQGVDLQMLEWSVPEGANIDDMKIIKRANPASWITVEALRSQRASTMGEFAFRRYHANQWTSAEEAWLPSGVWARLRTDERPAEGADAWVAVDAALKYDTTACVWATKLDDGRVFLQAKVWAARSDAPHHVLHSGGRISNREVKDFIHEELGQRYRLREIVADTRFFDAFLEELADHGYTVAEFPQQGAAMKDAWQHMYEAATAGTVCHDGDPVFAQHIDAVAAEPTGYGWRIKPLASWRPIDAACAAAMVRERAAEAVAVEPFAMAW